MFDQVMRSTLASHIEILAAISGRAWELLTNPKNASLYLEALTRVSSGQAVFNSCLADLLAIPSLRAPILQAIRDPKRSPALATAFGNMLQQLSTPR